MVATRHYFAIDAIVSSRYLNGVNSTYGASMTDRSSVKPLQLRLPTDLKAWIAAQADKNASSQNSEIVRAVRERMERQEAATA